MAVDPPTGLGPSNRLHVRDTKTDGTQETGFKTNDTQETGSATTDMSREEPRTPKFDYDEYSK